MSVSITTQHNDNARTGANLSEPTLNTSNVNPVKFGKLFEKSVDGQVYAQPLYLAGINIAGKARNVVYVATMHNSVYAFDADDPAAPPLWNPPPSLGPSVRLPDPNIGPPGYRDISVEVGILSTPVISKQRNALYVVAATKEGNVYNHKLHALDLVTGHELFGGPRTISATVPGSGSGSVNGTVSFVSNRQNQRVALTLANDVVYIAFAAYGDQAPYHGWVMGFHAGTLTPLVTVFNTTPDGEDGGIWQAGQGLAADNENNIYGMTGNGTFQTSGITDKVILPETAIGRPVACSINDATMVIGWTGTDPERHLNIETSPDGKNFPASTKVTLNETSFDGPGLTFGNGNVFLAWTGNDPEHHVNVVATPDCRNFGPKHTLPETSSHGPALAFGNGKLFLAWVGTDSNSSLNVAISTDGGATFPQKVTLAEQSGAPPGLAFFDGTLYLLWAGTDPNHSLNIIQSSDGQNFGNKITLGDTSDFPPALAKWNSLNLAWTGRDPAQSLNLMSGPDSHHLGNKATFGDAGAAAPALLTYHGALFILWTGTDPNHHVNVARIGTLPMLGDSFFKLRSDLTLADWFSPWNTQALNASDSDLGSGGALLIPGTNLLVGGGKEGKLYLLNRNAMGNFCSSCGNPAGDTQIVQWFQATLPQNAPPPAPPPAPASGGYHHIHGSPVFWQSPNRGPLIYIWGEADWLRAFSFNGTKFNPSPADISSVTTPGASMPGGMLTLSANGSTPGTGILWASHPTSQNANQNVVAGTLRAIDAGNLKNELWNSDMNPGRDRLGNVSKFSPPTVANGKVYVATFSNKLVVYGLL
jgi:hypothetical protein